MAISIRTRFLAISVTITAIGLSLFTHVIYDKAIGYKHLLERDAFRILAQQLVTTYDASSDEKTFNSLLSKHSNTPNQPAIVLATIDNNKLTNTTYKVDPSSSLLISQIFSEIKPDSKHQEGIIDTRQQSFFWLTLALPSESGKPLSLLAIYPLSSSVMTETLDFFGTPLFISGILLLWCMVWASIILSSLVNKLQKQKQTLSDQANDIKKARDEAMQANKAKSNFLANMSHEIRTPLTSIIGFAESCLDSSQSMQERYEATSTIIRSGNHLLHIINEILDISKIEAGKLEIEIRPVNLSDLLYEINLFIKVLAEEKGLTFNINHNFPLPKRIITDQLRLKQILLNLCANAIKFTQKGHVYLNVSYQPTKGYLQLEIEDTGIGMTTEQLDKIFAPFQQADTSITREYGGTGLGLTLSKQLIEILGGELTVESTPAEGSHFNVKLYADVTDDNEYIDEINYITHTPEGSSSLQNIPSVSGHILIAEDNPDIQALLKMLISKIGAELTIVRNGQEAVETAFASEFDIVFLDIQMPVMDGFEALRQLRAKGYNKPVFAMTANTMKKDQDLCFTSGFDGFISKPIDKNDLYSVIADYLKTADEKTKQPAFITSTILEEEPEIIGLVDAFLDRIPEITEQINLSLAEENWDEFSGHVHQMKGIGGAFGYSILTKISEKIEFALTSHDYEQLRLLIEDLNSVCQQAIAGKEENYKIIAQ